MAIKYSTVPVIQCTAGQAASIKDLCILDNYAVLCVCICGAHSYLLEVYVIFLFMKLNIIRKKWLCCKHDIIKRCFVIKMLIALKQASAKIFERAHRDKLTTVAEVLCNMSHGPN